MAEKRRFINNTDIGQNFLIDESVVAYTVKRAAVTPDDVILEIGPGGGILTRGLLSAGPRALCAVEVDERLRDGLEALASRDGRLRLFWGDAVRFDYRAELPETPTKIVANLPYHITTPILWTVQLESAERIASPERSRARSPLGVTVEAMGGAEILRKVPPQAFRPQPRVNSALIEIKIEKNRELANDRTWRALLARSFTQRRKTLVNNWTAGYADIDRERALAILDAHGLSATARAEELPLEKWFELAKEPDFQIKEKGGVRNVVEP